MTKKLDSEAFVSRTTVSPEGVRNTVQGKTPEQLEDEQIMAYAKSRCHALLSSWRQERPNEKFDQEALLAACIKQTREEFEARKAAREEQARRDREQRQAIEAHEAQERQQAIDSLTGRLSPEELAGRLLDLIELAQRCRVRVPPSLLA